MSLSGVLGWCGVVSKDRVVSQICVGWCLRLGLNGVLEWGDVG